MSGGGAPAPPATYQYAHQGAADNKAFGAIGGLEAMPNIPQNVYNAADAGFGGAVSAPNSYNPNDAVTYGGNVSAMPQTYLPYAKQLLSEGFNDNNAVYGRAAHNLTEQVRAGLGTRGLSMSPYGADLEAEAMGDFNLDWQDRQLDRMSGAFGAAMPGFQLAGNQMGQGQEIAQSGGRYQSNLAQALSAMGERAYTQPNMVAENYMRYLGGGTGADSVKASTYASQIEAYKAEQEAEAAMWAAIGELGGQATGAAIGAWG